VGFKGALGINRVKRRVQHFVAMILAYNRFHILLDRGRDKRKAKRLENTSATYSKGRERKSALSRVRTRARK
jgi:hypothetical protein